MRVSSCALIVGLILIGFANLLNYASSSELLNGIGLSLNFMALGMLIMNIIVIKYEGKIKELENKEN